jgi:arylsulfatase A
MGLPRAGTGGIIPPVKLALAILTGLCLLACTARAQRPNLVLVVADDLGYGDLACYGARDLHTPNLDRLAGDGVRFTSCYAGHANCSPARAALMTGRTPSRIGIRDWIPEDSPVHLRRSEVTVAALLRSAGYATCQVGKWHTNGEFNRPTQPQPGDHGFDHWFATHNCALPNHRNPNNFVRNGAATGRLEGYAAHLVADEALRWLGARDPSAPFFLYVCFHEPHEPIASAPRYTALYPHKDPAYSAHHGNITQMDDAFGRLMAGLDGRGFRTNTLVFFTSDNGPAVTTQHPYGSAGPLRDKKGSLWEGGIRVPGILRWPGRAVPGTVCDEPISGVDFLPTVCAAAGLPQPGDRAIDGANWLPALTGGSVERKTPLYWHFNRASGGPQVALRVGGWKILASVDRPPPPRGNDITGQTERDFKEAGLRGFMLFNLETDLSEARDLATEAPAKLAELRAMLESKYAEVRAESPVWPAWKFTGSEGKKIEWPDYTRKKTAASKTPPR